MATADKRVMTDATGQAIVAELRKIPGVTNPLPVAKGGTGLTSLDQLKEALNVPEKQEVDALKSAIELKATKAELKEAKRRIHLLEEAAVGKLYTQETVTETSYQQDVPSGSLSNAVIGMWGGKSVVWNQFYEPSYTSYSDRGVTSVYDSETKKIQLSGVLIEDYFNFFRSSNFDNKLKAGNKAIVIVEILENPNNVSFNNFGLFNRQLSFSVHNGTNIAIYNNGDTTSGASIGFRVPSGTDVTGVVVRVCFIDAVQYGASDITSVDDPRIAEIEAYALAHPEYNAGTIVSADVNAIQTADTGETVMQTYTIPSAVLQQYPLRSAGSVYDTITYEPQTVDGVTVPKWYHTQKIGEFDFDSIQFGYNASYGFYASTDGFTGIKHDVDSVNMNALAKDYTTIDASITAGHSDMAFCIGSNYVYVADGRYTSSSAFNSAEKGKFYAELATPVRTDITELMQNWDGVLEVEEGGTVTFKQVGDSIFAVPNAVNYLVKTTGGA